MSSGFPPLVIAAIKWRSGGWCEGCGVKAATEAHHRQYRSRGGTETLDNGLRLCGWGNHTGCHGIAHTSEGERRGWSVRSGYSTLIVPALLTALGGASQGWYRLPTEGAPQLISTEEALAYMAHINARTEGT
jgi:hypothetical protein